MAKKCLSVVLVLTLCFGAFAVPASAASGTEDLPIGVYQVLEKMLNFVLSYFNLVYPGAEPLGLISEYSPAQFYAGEDTFGYTPGDAFYVGYGSGSLQTGNEIAGQYYMAGNISVEEPKTVTAVYDDQRVRTFAISDGENGAAVFVVLDAYAFSNIETQKIRARLKDFAAENGIISLNVSVLHQHSAVDTLGLNCNLFESLANNTLIYATGGDTAGVTNGKNKEFMEHLYTVTEQSVRDAVADMRPGKLYFGYADASAYIKDKRDPQVADENLYRLRFVPTDGSKETWISNIAMHCVSLGAAGTELSGDYPYYMEQVVKAAGANYVMLQGAEAAISQQQEAYVTEGMSRYDGLTALGTLLGNMLVNIDNETELAPIFNIRFAPCFLPVDNEYMAFAQSAGFVDSEMVYDDNGNRYAATELGYIELGETLAIATAPGELAAEIAYGGAFTAEQSPWGTSWDYPSMQETVGARRLLVFGLTNDQVGYLLPDNEWQSIFTENEELCAQGQNVGSAYMATFAELVASTK